MVPSPRVIYGSWSGMSEMVTDGPKTGESSQSCDGQDIFQYGMVVSGQMKWTGHPREVKMDASKLG